MSNYSKTTDFAAKDALTTGNANKIVKGTEIDDEFEAIQTAVNSKADKNNTVLTGTPTAPTAASATDTTQIATTAFVQSVADAVKEALYPVGSIYTNATNNTNPATLLGFGTWEVFGAGRVMVGINGSDTSFDTLEETGGTKDAIVVSHTHSFSATTGSAGSHFHYIANGDGTGSSSPQLSSTNYLSAFRTGGGDVEYYANGTSTVASIGKTNTQSNHNHSVSGTTGSAGSNGTNDNLQPYIVVRMWKRTA